MFALHLHYTFIYPIKQANTIDFSVNILITTIGNTN